MYSTSARGPLPGRRSLTVHCAQAMLWSALGCQDPGRPAETAASVWEDGLSLPDDRAPAPDFGSIALWVDPLVVGGTASFRVTGAQPGEEVLLVRGRSLGAGPCWAPAGGICLDIAGQVAPIGPALADANGVASWSRPVPGPAAPGSDLALQAVIVRGGNGVDSVKSRPRLATVVAEAPSDRLGVMENPMVHACPPGAAPGATCWQGIVQCAGLTGLRVTIAVSEPVGPASGTVATLFGGGGTTFFDEGFPAAYLSRGLRVAQYRFAGEWPDTDADIGAAACRPATVLQWIFENIHGGDRGRGYCAHQHSGGAGALGYALARYGHETILDFALEDAGPVFSRLDYGCDPYGAGLNGTRRYVCPELTSGTFVYTIAAPLIDRWDNSSTCGPPYLDAPPGQVQDWADHSVLGADADTDFPDTEVSFWFCANNANEAAGQGSLFADAITSAKMVHCVTGQCAVEPPWTDPDAFVDMVDEMASRCVPRH